MKEPITDHHDGTGLNENITIVREDDAGQDGAHHDYSAEVPYQGDIMTVAEVSFQKGPRLEDGSINGTTEPVLIAIVLDRLRTFQAGSLGCRENALAITKLEEALHWMQHRARERAKRGVLGTVKK